MIPYVTPFDHSPPSRGLERSAFARGAGERPLAVIVDSSTCKSDDARRLLGLQHNKLLRLDRISLDQITVDDDGCATLDFTRGDRQIRHFCRVARHNLNVLSQWDVALDTVADPDIERRLILAMMARQIGSDAFVTEAPQVLDITRRFYPTSNPMTPTSALALVGLHLRLREDFVYRQSGPVRYQTNSERFYDLMGYALLPDIWRWFELCEDAASALDPSPRGLARGIHHRITHVLRARDRLHGYLLRETSDVTMTEALFYFGSLLVELAGAFDAAARVADSAYGIRKPRQASWRSSDWRTRLVTLAPILAPVLADKSQTRDTLDVIYLLRNSIHEEPLKLIGRLSEGGHITRYQAAVPAEQRAALLDIISRRGGGAAWGIEELNPELLSIDLHAYVEQILRTATTELNTLFRMIEVERYGLQSLPQYGPPESIALDLPEFRLLGGLA